MFFRKCRCKVYSPFKRYLCHISSMEALNLSDIYNQNLTQFYSIFNDCWTVVELICLPIMFYIVYTKSPPSMVVVKWHMLYHLRICGLFNFLCGLWKPLPLFPLYLGYSTV